MIDRIEVNVAGGRYQVTVGRGLLDDTSRWAGVANDQLVVISNDVVAPLYLDRLKAALPKAPELEIIIEDGEHNKSVENWTSIHQQLASFPIARDATLIALGGGVIGDLTGFVAATYMRGIRFIQIPTTLLAQVDASVGGKTAINLAAGKNMVGAFHQPSAVLIDPDTLSTLPARETAAGWAEVVKIALVRDPSLLERVDRCADADFADHEQLDRAIAQAVRNKVEVVAADEREAGIRAHLNLGHTFGHAIETVTDYRQYLHGEAVAIGLVAAANLSASLGMVDASVPARVSDVLRKLDLPTQIPGLSASSLLDVMKADKKVLQGCIRLILLTGIGQACIRNDIPTPHLIDTLVDCGAVRD